MSNQKEKSEFTKYSNAVLTLCIAAMLVVALLTLFSGGVQYKNYGESKYGDLDRELNNEEPDGILYLLEYRGGFSPGESEVFAEKVDSLLTRLTKDDMVILNVESPGGASNSCSHSYNQVERIKSYGIKVIGVSDYMAASCGYMLLSSSDIILVGEGSDIGNIGTIMRHSKQDQPLVGSTRTKELLAGRTPRGSDMDVLRDMVKSAHKLFVDTVLRERKDNIKAGDFEEVFSGKIFTGRDAVRLGLADENGDKRTILMSAYLDGMDVVEVQYKVPPIVKLTSK